MKRNSKHSLADFFDELIVWTCLFIAIALFLKGLPLWS